MFLSRHLKNISINIVKERTNVSLHTPSIFRSVVPILTEHVVFTSEKQQPGLCSSDTWSWPGAGSVAPLLFKLKEIRDWLELGGTVR